jgi:RimJ/RimL family protein N-acetyltransferase
LIDGTTVRLRPFGVDDTDFLLRWNNDHLYLGDFEPLEPVSREELGEWLPKEKSGQLWYVIETPEGEKVGQIVGRHQEDGSVQIGYRIIPYARGKGYCTEAVRALITHLFSLGVERVVAEVNTGNKPSIRVLEKLGFRDIEYNEKLVRINEFGWVG